MTFVKLLPNYIKFFLFKLLNCWDALIWVTDHCNRAAVSRNGVEKTVDTHKITPTAR